MLTKTADPTSALVAPEIRVVGVPFVTLPIESMKILGFAIVSHGVGIVTTGTSVGSGISVVLGVVAGGVKRLTPHTPRPNRDTTITKIMIPCFSFIISPSHIRRM
jgi:hypothetical protein